MYPILFTIPGIDYPISTFGVMMSLGFLAAYWLTLRELPGKGIDPELSSNLLLFVMIMYHRRSEQGDSELAAPLLEAALTQFRELGMTGWARRAEELQKGS